MQSWRDMAAYYVGTWDFPTPTRQLKFTIADDMDKKEITQSQSLCALFTTDTIHIPVFTDLELKHLEPTGVLTLRTNFWKWNFE